MSPNRKKLFDFLFIKLDGTPNKGKLGANAIVGVSTATAVAGAAAKGVPLYQYLADLASVKPPFILPTPCSTVIGGKHAGNNLAIQEFMIQSSGATSFAEAMKMVTETYHNLKKVTNKKYGLDATNGGEGDFVPKLSTAEGALDPLVEAINASG